MKPHQQRSNPEIRRVFEQSAVYSRLNSLARAEQLLNMHWVEQPAIEVPVAQARQESIINVPTLPIQQEFEETILQELDSEASLAAQRAYIDQLYNPETTGQSDWDLAA